MNKIPIIIVFLLLIMPIAKADITWEFPDKIEAGSYYESTILIDNLQDKQIVIVGEFFPRGTIIVDYKLEGVYEEEIKSYIGKQEDYVVLQMSAKEEYAKIILSLIAPNIKDDNNLRSELVYILSPNDYGTKNQTLNLIEPIQLEFPTLSEQKNENSKNSMNWVMIMSLLLLGTAVLVMKEEKIHDTTLKIVGLAKIKGKQYYSATRKKTMELILEAKEYSIQKSILNQDNCKKKNNMNVNRVNETKAKKKVPLKKKDNK